MDTNWVSGAWMPSPLSNWYMHTINPSYTAANYKYPNVIHTLIKEAENIEFELNLRLYELLDDKSYLETTYNQIQEKASAMEEELSKKFLSYPIPKAIVEEWEQVK